MILKRSRWERKTLLFWGPESTKLDLWILDIATHQWKNSDDNAIDKEMIVGSFRRRKWSAGSSKMDIFFFGRMNWSGWLISEENDQMMFFLGGGLIRSELIRMKLLGKRLIIKESVWSVDDDSGTTDRRLGKIRSELWTFSTIDWCIPLEPLISIDPSENSIGILMAKIRKMEWW